MDQSYSDSDVTSSPTQILERLQMLRRIQILQRSKLQKQQLEYINSPEITASITELATHFSDSTSYNTFRTLLQPSEEYESDHLSDKSNYRSKDLKSTIEGISLLNLSQESEYINHSPVSSAKLNNSCTVSSECNKGLQMLKKQISLDEMPILSPKKNFEALLLEKLKTEKPNVNNFNLTENPKDKTNKAKITSKKPFLKRGEGMARFGINKDKLVIQNTKALPWKKNSKQHQQTKPLLPRKKSSKFDEKVQLTVDETSDKTLEKQSLSMNKINNSKLESRHDEDNNRKCNTDNEPLVPPGNPHQQTSAEFQSKPHNVVTKSKQPIVNTIGKTWAAVLSKEQNDLLVQLKQSDYYKNFLSPNKGTNCDVTCDENFSKISQEKEVAEQNLFELLEKKVNHDSFHIENSFFNKFLRRTLDNSGESTPLIFQKCISNNPKLMNIAPSEHHGSYSHMESCECMECSDNCSTMSCSCSCKTATDVDKYSDAGEEIVKKVITTEKNKSDKEVKNDNKNKDCQDDIVVNNEVNTNMAEINAKLIATSELLKDRLRELEDEIETFRCENANLNKMREEIDGERQRFFEEKQEFEKKFHEEKILSEYYIAEEKEKLLKQKQMYERYVREIRGRLNKKDKDEVVCLKKEIQELKEEIRLKDAKSTTAIARLRNQIKIIDKEKKSLIEEVENLKKENRRIQHSNDITRRLTNIKYLEQINKKLTNIASRDEKSEVVLDPDTKYKAHTIERQSRAKTLQPHPKNSMRRRTKSVPNLNVTSRYAKYFSQKDSCSDMQKCNVINNNSYPLDNIEYDEDIMEDNLDMDRIDSSNSYVSDEDNNLEVLYNEKFKAKIPLPQTNSKTDTLSNTDISSKLDVDYENSSFFLNTNSRHNFKGISNSECTDSMQHKKNSSLTNSSKSPTAVMNLNSLSGRSMNKNARENSIYHDSGDRQATKSPILINHPIYQTQQLSSKEYNTNIRISPSNSEPSISKTNIMKTNLNPTEITKPDGFKELRFPNGNVKIISPDGKYSKFIYYNGDTKENFYNEGRIKYFYFDTKTYHTTYPDGLEVLEFQDGQIEKRYKDGSSEIRLPNGSVRYADPKNKHITEEWRFPDGIALTVSANNDRRVVFPNGQIEVHAKDHKRREFPDGTVKVIYNDGTSETRYASGRIRIKDKHGNLIMDSAPG